MKRLPLVLLAISTLLATLYGGFVLNEQNRWSGDFLLLFSDVDAPATLVHALIGLPVLGLMVAILVRQRILLMPQQSLTLALVGWVAVLGFSIPFSVSRSLSVTQWAEFLVAVCTLFAVVGHVGRHTGPRVILGAFSAGGTVLAIRGILEYAAVRRDDPSWRIFAGWVNPNATVAILAVAIFCSLALMLQADRLPRLGLGVATSLMLFAAALTGSKGGLALALPLGLIAFGMVATEWTGRAGVLYRVGGGLLVGVVGVAFLKDFGPVSLLLGAAYVGIGLWADPERPIAAWAVPFVVFGLLVAGLSRTAPTPTAGASVSSSPLQRVVKRDATTDQSVTFRLNLWKSAVKLAEERPLFGFGIGTYRVVSARPGITTSTLYAHSSYLQLAAEGGVVALAGFLAVLALWARLTLRGLGSIPRGNRVLLAGVVSAVAFLGIHGLVDSDLYYFGLSVAMFGLMGVGLLLAADAVAPEYTSPSFRFGAISAVVLTAVLSLATAQLDSLKSRGRGAGAEVAASQDPQAAQEAYKASLEALRPWAGVDSEAAYISANLLSGSERLAMLRQALELTPSPRIARRIARDLMEQGQFLQAADAVSTGLIHDPNNLPGRLLKIRAYLSYGEKKRASAEIESLIGLENSPYVKVRSLGEVVPTETYEARFLGLPESDNPKIEADRIADGVRGMLRYRSLTAEIIRAQNAKLPGFALGDEDLAKATAKLQTAAEAAEKAAGIYSKLGKTAEAEEMRLAAAAFRDF